jgi:trehalose synthase-fused probable maltokinase
MASKTPPSDRLAAWLGRQRWYATKTRAVSRVDVEDVVEVGGGVVMVARVVLDDGGVDRYALTLATGPDPREALDDAGFCAALLALIADDGTARGRHGALVGRPTSAYPRASQDPLDPRRVGGEQSNSSVVFGRTLILKLLRRPQAGPNPEEEMTRFLTERAQFANAPRLAGHIEYRPDAGVAMTLAVAQEFVPDGRDGWQWMLDALGRFLSTTGARDPDRARVPALAGETLAAVRRLGEVTGGLHRALTVDSVDPAFAPEIIGAGDVAGWVRAVATQLDAAGRVLGSSAAAVPADALREALEALRGTQKIRHHGDLHLGQTLYRERARDFVLIDFEGEPLRPLAERRLKHAPIRDVAGLVRSIDYAAAAAARGGPREAWTRAWRDIAEAELLGGYRGATAGAAFVPAPERDFRRALAAFVIEKAAYEVVYEANHRPDWLSIPREGLLRASAALAAATRAGTGPAAGAA